MYRKLLIFSALAIVFIFSSCKKDKPSFEYKIDILAKNLKVPWGLAYLPNGDLIFTERFGTINLLKKDSDSFNLIGTRPVLDLKEGGLLSIAVDPDFENTNYLFVYETVSAFNRIVRLIFKDGTITEDKIILEEIPSHLFHNGGGLRFGPDGYLYIGTGDARNPNMAQDLDSLGGKILRVDKEGNPAPGNPFGSLVWTYGHRNVQGFDWNADGKMLATEHGPSGEINGWCCHDELNLIEPGNNYGWPLALGGTELSVDSSFTPPLAQSGDDTWAPSGGSFITGKMWKKWEGEFILAGLRGERLIHFALNASADEVVNQADLFTGQYFRLRSVIMAPDGSIIFCTSNIDGKNRPFLAGDDKIYRMYK
ncbi:MAG: PQQ-dependent sugar dehydrogenase [Bacteroidetes bacterium]|nr:PQQ-dependent sugar dehydrogenase [Bacteroidota bacterium]